ncbi:hypothetical protein [Klebsiella variicola]|uniref:hypothetical protein n=1 Tax=Klebsiella variicola TaxID=244366 RepID=UPI0011E56CED|nr:hypothetical protein [Klebsiella variicola]EKU8545020.1 hypothetical protein [Klebsiella variicola]ELT5800423.1 hypothetical protein [Klebsiella variicola]
MKWLIGLILLVLSGCSVNNDTSFIQESLLQECSSDTPIPEDGTGAAAYSALNDWQTIYNECREGKHALIKAVNGNK